MNLSAITTIFGEPTTILGLSAVVVFVLALLVSSSLVFLVHRYTVLTYVKQEDATPFYWLSGINIALFLLWMLVTTLVPMSFYIVLFVGWIPHVIGYLLYQRENERHVRKIKSSDMRNAFFITAIIFTMVAMMFVSTR